MQFIYGLTVISQLPVFFISLALLCFLGILYMKVHLLEFQRGNNVYSNSYGPTGMRQSAFVGLQATSLTRLIYV